MKFLGRAKKFLQDLSTESDPRVQYFNVCCASGHRIRGERTEGYQALRCPVCGDGIFVLPRSPLPEPIAPSSAGPERHAVAAARVRDEGPIELADASHMAVDIDDRVPGRPEIEIDWQEDPRPGKPSGGPPAKAVPVAAPARLEHDVETASAAQPKHRPSIVAVVPMETRQERNRRLFQSLARHRNQIIFAAVPLLLVAAVGWRIVNNRRQEYPITIERGKTEGIPALDEGNFDKAYQLLSAARSAVDALGGEIEGADTVRQAADEAAIFVDQCSRSLEEMLEEAGRNPPETWASKFETFYKGKSLILDTWITAAPSAGDAKPYRLAYKVFPPGQPGNFRDETGSRPDRFADIDLTGFELFRLAPRKVGDHVTIGARLASFQYDLDGDRWVVGFEPKSGVDIQHTKALDASGWADETGSSEPRGLLP